MDKVTLLSKMSICLIFGAVRFDPTQMTPTRRSKSGGNGAGALFFLCNNVYSLEAIPGAWDITTTSVIVSQLLFASMFMFRVTFPFWLSQTSILEQTRVCFREMAISIVFVEKRITTSVHRRGVSFVRPVEQGTANLLLPDSALIMGLSGIYCQGRVFP